MADTGKQSESTGKADAVQTRRSLTMRLVGLRRRPGRRIPVLPTLWGWALLAFFTFIIGGMVFAEYSMQPDFCRSCHIMEPYYQAWHNSTHRDVACGDCHFEPGWRHTIKGKFEASSQAVKYITNTYGSKPHAEVRDASCARAAMPSDSWKAKSTGKPRPIAATRSLSSSTTPRTWRNSAGARNSAASPATARWCRASISPSPSTPAFSATSRA